MEENWRLIYEIDKYEPDTYIWLEEALKKDNIPYKTKIEEYWVGIRIPKYMNKLEIFIPQEYEKTVRKYIEEYEDSKSIISENIEELKNVDNEENDIEINKYGKIRKKFFEYYMIFLILVILIVVIGIIAGNL